MSNWQRQGYTGSSAFDEVRAIFECENYHTEDELIYKVEEDKFRFQEPFMYESKVNICSSAALIDSYIKTADEWFDKHGMEHLKEYSGCRVEDKFLILYKEDSR